MARGNFVAYPIGHPPMEPWLFLLATPSKYYVYDFQTLAMLEAGDTLTEVIDGMRKEGWMRLDCWKELPFTKREDPSDYIPVYLTVPHTNENHELVQQVKEFMVTRSYKIT